MALYSYQALNAQAREITGTVTAETPRQARDLLREQGLEIEQVWPIHDRRSAVGVGHWQTLVRRWQASRQSSQVTELIRELATLLGVGVPLLEALETLSQSRQGPMQQSIWLLKDRIAAGAGLAEAMQDQPCLFDEMGISLVEVGQHTGTLEEVLEQWADFRQKSEQWKGRLFSVLMYPVLVLCMAVGVSLFLMTFVVPKILGTLQEMGRPMPWATRVVKSISDEILHRGWLWGLLLLMLVGLLVWIYRTPWGRQAWHRWQWRWPLFGPLLRWQAISRLSLVLATLLKSGIVFERALPIVRQSTQNRWLNRALEQCEEAIRAGRDIAPALQQTQIFPPAVIHVFAVGQQSGRLEEMLERLSRDYDRQATLASQRLTAALEPLLIVLLAVIVGFIAFATFLPILEAGRVM